ncbi:MAG: helix-turn-helix domain-containing protein [Candidatus Firestonebacteria bacterium]
MDKKTLIKYPWYELGRDLSGIKFGHVVLREPAAHPDRILDFWVFGYIFSGELSVQIGQEKALRTGGYYLLPPGVRHFGFKKELSDIYYVHFKAAAKKLPEIPELYCNKLRLPLFGEVRPNIPVLNIFNNLIARERTGLATQEYYAGQLLALLSEISFSYLLESKGVYPEKRLALDLLDFLNRSAWLPELNNLQLEKKFGFSYRHLNRLFKAEYNSSLHNKFMELKIERAYQLLIRGESLREIALKTGFDDYFYFLKVFKKFKKTTPKAVRKQYFIK